MRSEINYANKLPDRSDTDIPQEVQWFLSVCELATVYRPWLEVNMGGPVDNFCEGVVDYYWQGEEFEEPTFSMLFDDGLFGQTEDIGNWPSAERIAFQKGAIVGYKLQEKYDG